MNESNNKGKEEKSNIICIWKKGDRCNSCKIKDKLDCRATTKYRYLYRFGMIFNILIIIIGIINILRENILDFHFIYIFLLIFVNNIVFYFLIIKQYIMCRHCPYYNISTTLIQCLNNIIGLKLFFKYTPKKISMIEKIIFIIMESIFILLPLPLFLLSNQYLLLFLYLFGVIFMESILIFFICTRCANIYCNIK